MIASSGQAGVAGWMDGFSGYLSAGGLIMPILLLVCVLMWYAIGARWALLQRGSRKNVRVLIKRHAEGRTKPPNGIVDAAIALAAARVARGGTHLRAHLDEDFAPFERDLKRHGRLVTALVAIAPLLGLLGTVSGMIETFASLGDMSLFSQTGGIAGGIAVALFTTQMGLVVAVPGLLAKAVLDRRQQQIQHDLDQIKDIYLSTPAVQGA